MNRTGVVGVIVAAVWATTACVTVERPIFTEVTCALPPMPAPPTVTGRELEPLADEVYWRVLQRDRELQDSLLEHRAMLQELCGR